jgi:tight adherence protein C
MEMIDAFFERIVSDPGLMLGAFGLCVIGALAMAAIGIVQAKQDVKRRAEAGIVKSGSRATHHKAARFDAVIHSLDSLVAQQNPREMKLLRRQLVQAGFFAPQAVAIFLGLRVGLAAVLGAILVSYYLLLSPATAPNQMATWTVAAAISGYFLPNVLLKKRITSRIDQHRVGFPDFMDLMVVCSEAGLSMESAIERIARELADGYPSLAENLYMVSLEIRAGKTFVSALDGLGERLGIEEAIMLATLLQQSSELGSSLSGSLRIYSEEMRNKRLARAEEKAYALPAKLTIPLTLFVFPVLIATLMVPVVIRFQSSGF